MVLDVKAYKKYHPGGSFLVKQTVGRDISKFFYGGYTIEYEEGYKPYAHSNIARMVVNNLAIAYLE